MQLIIVVALLVLCFLTLRSSKVKKQKETAHSSAVPSNKSKVMVSRETSTSVDDPPRFSTTAACIVELQRPDRNYRFTEEDHADILGIRDFCVLDVETTGLVPSSDRIVQIGIIKVKDLVPVARLNTLVNPEIHIPSKATEIHGITDEMVMSSPKYHDIADHVYSLLNNTTVVGHNVTFDLNFIQILLLQRSDPDSDLTIDFIDTEQYARQVLPGMPNYKLQSLLKFYDIDPGTAHTAYDDAFATLQLFHALRYEFVHKQELEEKRAEEKRAERKKKREEEKAARRVAFAASPLLEQRFCFTGSFSLEREAMENLALSVGALVQEKEPNGKTAYLVKGDVSGLPEWALERKLRKAESLSAAGKPVKIIDEAEYLHLISDAKSALSASSEVENL